jgi:hypothetical protein
MITSFTGGMSLRLQMYSPDTCIASYMFVTEQMKSYKYAFFFYRTGSRRPLLADVLSPILVLRHTCLLLSR